MKKVKASFKVLLNQINTFNRALKTRSRVNQEVALFTRITSSYFQFPPAPYPWAWRAGFRAVQEGHLNRYNCATRNTWPAGIFSSPSEGSRNPPSVGFFVSVNKNRFNGFRLHDIVEARKCGVYSSLWYRRFIESNYHNLSVFTHTGPFKDRQLCNFIIYFHGFEDSPTAKIFMCRHKL